MISERMRRHGVAAILGLAAMAAALALAAGPAGAADAAGFSFQGTMAPVPTPQQDWHFTIADTSAMDFRTWAWGGGTNFMGETILPGGNDSVLWLYDSGMNLIATNDDIGPGILDSQISGPFAGGNYTLRLTAYGLPPVLGDGHWAADLVNWSGSLTVTDLPQISSTVTSLSMGGLGAATATLALAHGANLTVANSGSGVEQPGGLGQLFIGSYSGPTTGAVTLTDHGYLEQSPTLPSYIGARVGTGQTVISPTGTLTINGGSASLGDLFVLPGGMVNFFSGSLGFRGDLTVGPGGLFGSFLGLGSERNLALSGKTTVEAGSFLILYGGALSTGSLKVYGSFMWESGTLDTWPGTLTNQVRDDSSSDRPRRWKTPARS